MHILIQRLNSPTNIQKMERSLDWVVYCNLKNLLACRNTTSSHDFLEEDAFKRHIGHYGMIRIDAAVPATNYVMDASYNNRRQNARVLHVFLIGAGSAAASTLQNFNKMIQTLTTEQLSSPDILIISSDPLSSFIRSRIKVLRQTYPQMYLEYHSTAKFSIVMYEHPSVPKHTILKVGDDADLKTLDHAALAQITTEDTQVVWLGAPEGTILRIERVSATACISIAYRLVV